MSRIHDALKKAEAERAQAASGNGHSETAPETCDAHASGAASVALPTGTESVTDSNSTVRPGELLPSLNANLPQSRVGAVAAEMPRQNGPDFRVPHKAAACDAAFLEKCPRFDWAPIPSKMLSANESKYRIGAEEFRTLRSSLELVRKQHLLKTVLVTSPLPREGKTFVAVNLAQALGWQRERRVLLIDGDLRLSRVHTCFGEMPRKPGLADYLSGDVDPIPLIRRGPEDNLFVLPAGLPGSNALELIGNGRLKALIQWLTPAFDWIVIDSPPAVPVSDARLIAESCDGVLFVIRAGHTPSDLAQRSMGEIRGKRYLGIVLNAVDTELAASSYYYGGNGNGAVGKGAA